ncbi:hypothetical protein WJ978_08975 [Achromobacter xylosoxidans]
MRFDYYAMLDAGFVRRRRDLVAQVLSQDLLLFVTPEVYRWIAFLFDARRIRCSIALFEEVHQRAQQPRADRMRWRANWKAMPGWCCSMPTIRNMRTASASTRRAGYSAEARWRTPRCSCLPGWARPRCICMAWT